MLLWRVCLPKQPKLRQEQPEDEKLVLLTHMEVTFHCTIG